jgi:RimJ/RimL family protein N-acetyltransferase
VREGPRETPPVAIAPETGHACSTLSDVPEPVSAFLRSVASAVADLIDDSPPLAGCRNGRHVLRTPSLRLQTPTVRDLKMMMAAASDPQAQRWLGWSAELVVAADDVQRLLTLRAGEGRLIPRPSGDQWYLAAVEWATGQLAGAVGCDPDGRELGGWLAPRYRGRGLGRELFAGAALFAHQHLGVSSVVAGTEVSNAACITALVSAGFAPDAGPPTHRLPDGRVVPVRWLRHETDHPARCDGMTGFMQSRFQSATADPRH